MTEYLYRVFEQTYAPMPDAHGESRGPGSRELRCHRFKILRYTPKGCWIPDYDGREKFVNFSHRKMWAHKTQALAVEAFIARKKRQQEILAHQLHASEEFQRMAELNKITYLER